MDLEQELRQAMAEHVAGVSAPDALAERARRGYRRSVRVRALTVGAVAAAVVAIAAMPTYQAFRPEPVGAPGRAHPGGAPAGNPAAPSARTQTRPAPAPTATTPATAPAARPNTRPPAQAHGTGGGRGGHRSLLTYLPAGLRQVEPCATTKATDRETMSCRWSGGGGMIEVRVVRGPVFGGPAEIGWMPPVPVPTHVHDQPAIRGEWPNVGSQVSWVESSGVGVWVGVGRELDGRLMRIAEGVRVTPF
ncbi:MAG TPA: hypothetical protein VF069_25600 [Streptosporangiaceae bacterium]